MKRIIVILSVLLSLSACDSLDIKGLVKGSSPNANTRFAKSKEYNDAYGIRRFAVPSEEYEVYVATDAHLESSAEGMTRFVEDYLDDSQAAPFSLFIGDATGKKNCFDFFLNTISPIAEGGRSLLCTPGNHDLYYGQWDQYIDVMKTASYCFEVEMPSGMKDLYICLDSAEGTLGTDQREWLGRILAPSDNGIRKTVVFTHTHFFKRDNSQGHTSNFNLEEGYDLEALFAERGVDVVISGHDHYFEETIFKGVTYWTLNSIDDSDEQAHYYKLKVAQDETKLTPVRIR